MQMSSLRCRSSATFSELSLTCITVTTDQAHMHAAVKGFIAESYGLDLLVLASLNVLLFAMTSIEMTCNLTILVWLFAASTIEVCPKSYWQKVVLLLFCRCSQSLLLLAVMFSRQLHL